MKEVIIDKLPFNLNNRWVHRSMINAEDPTIHPSIHPSVCPSIFSTNIYWIPTCVLSMWFEPFCFGLIAWRRHHPSEHLDSTSCEHLTPPPLSCTLPSISSRCLFFLRLIWSIFSLPCPLHCSFSSLTNSQLSCCSNFLSGSPASIIFLPNPLYMLCPELPPIFCFNQHFLRFVECRHCIWTLKELTVQRRRETKFKGNYHIG